MLPSSLSSQVRHLTWASLHVMSKDRVFLGKGAFGKCYCINMGPMKSCIKVFRPESKYANLFYNDVRMLAVLCHENLPWLYGVCNEAKHPRIIAMSHHSFCGNTGSSTVHVALKSEELFDQLNTSCWKRVVLRGTTALAYLQCKGILHNDIKADNIVIEKLPPNYNQCRSILIDFGKACYVAETTLYHLSPEQKERYKAHHPQVAPEVRNGVSTQSFASDMYAFGRVLRQINLLKLKLPVVSHLAEQCLDQFHQRRPTIDELHTFLLQLFNDS